VDEGTTMSNPADSRHLQAKSTASPLLWAMLGLLVVFPWISKLFPQVMQDYITVLFR